jgi:hypothetical protein
MAPTTNQLENTLLEAAAACWYIITRLTAQLKWFVLFLIAPTHL